MSEIRQSAHLSGLGLLPVCLNVHVPSLLDAYGEAHELVSTHRSVESSWGTAEERRLDDERVRGRGGG